MNEILKILCYLFVTLVFALFLYSIACHIFCTLFEMLDNTDDFDDKLIESFEKNELIFYVTTNPSKNIYDKKTFYDKSIFPDILKIDHILIKNEIMSNMTTYDMKNIKIDEIKYPHTYGELQKINNLLSAKFVKIEHKKKLPLKKKKKHILDDSLVCHLGLYIPENKCEIYVIGKMCEKMYYVENEWILFDDGLYHSIGNNDDLNKMVVLKLRIKRSPIVSEISEIQIETSEADLSTNQCTR